MNDFDLDSTLKAARVPERGEGYWETFPRRVLARSRATPEESVQRVWLPRLAWGGGVACACLMIGAGFSSGLDCPRKTVAYAMQSVQSFQADLAQFPSRVRNVMQIEHGLHALIEDQP